MPKPKNLEDSESEDAIETSKKGKKKETKDRKRKSRKPKGASSAYNIYVAERRARINAETPGLSFGDISKRVSADWKQLTDEQRKHYEEQAAEDKKRYDREMAEYSGSEEDTAPPKKKKKKAPDAPKKNLNAWMFFIAEVRPQIVAELGEDGKRIPLVTKAIGERWAKMTPEQKQPYEDMAAEDKKRYTAEMDAYNAAH